MSTLIKLEFPGKPPLVPSLEIPLFKTQLSADIAENLEKIVLKEKDHILANTELPEKVPPTWLTGRFWFYNLLDYDYEELRHLKTFIADEYTNYLRALGETPGSCYIRVWANVLKFNQNISWHNHFDCVTATNLEIGPFPHVSGNICVRTFDTKTWFRSPLLGGAGEKAAFGLGSKYKDDVVGISNVVGECLFFPSWLPHRTDTNMLTTPRITISFDIIPEEVYLAKENNQIFRKLI